MQKTAFQNFAGGGVPIEEIFLISDVFVKNRPKWGTEMRCSSHGAQKQTKMVQTVEAIVHRFDLVIAPESDSCGFCGRVKQIS